MTSINVTAAIAGKAFSVNSFDIAGGVYGSTGHAEIQSSRKLLINAGIDILALTTQAPASVEVDVYVTVDNVITRIFGGEYLSSQFHYDADMVTIHARDWAGPLVDQRRVLTQVSAQTQQILSPGQVAGKGILTQNKTIGEIVQYIADEFGLANEGVLLPQDMPGTNSINVGAKYAGSDTTLLSVPQTLWGILSKLAVDNGYEVYVTPLKALVFGLGGQTKSGGVLPTINLNYNTTTVPSGSIPCKNLVVDHQPRRNGTFRVQVISYDPGIGQITVGRATVVGTNLAGNATNDYQPGIWTGSDAIALDSSFASSGTPVPLYTFNIEGMTQPQAQQRAFGIAGDISKREMFLSASIDGMPSIQPTQPVTISGNVDPLFAGNKFYVSGYQHTFRMPKNPGKGSEGFMTMIKALNVPEPGNGTPLKPKKTVRK